jgi:predicted dehydrogenase
MRRRIVQVGVAPSGIGLDWLRAITQAPDWTLAGIVDTRPEHLQSAAERVGLSAERCFTTIGAAASALDFDACVLVVPSPLHAALCTQALDARKHVIVEKPFTVDFADARALAARAEQEGLCLVVDQNYRYMTEMGTLRRAIHDRVAGAPSFMRVTFDCLWPGRPYQWSMADTMLLEMAIHHFDAMRYVLGAEPRTALGQTWRPPWTRYHGDTVVSCQFEFDDGTHVAYQGSLESPGRTTPWPGVWRVECAEGALHLADLGAGYGVYRSREPDVIERIAPIAADGRPQEPSLLGTLREVAAALDEGRCPQSDARDNLRTLAMAFAVSQSAREGSAIDLAQQGVAAQA